MVKEINCLTCKYVDKDNIEFSKFVENYCRFGCKLKGYTEWLAIEEYNYDQKLLCGDWEEKDDKEKGKRN